MNSLHKLTLGYNIHFHECVITGWKEMECFQHQGWGVVSWRIDVLLSWFKHFHINFIKIMCIEKSVSNGKFEEQMCLLPCLRKNLALARSIILNHKLFPLKIKFHYFIFHIRNRKWNPQMWRFNWHDSQRQMHYDIMHMSSKGFLSYHEQRLSPALKFNNVPVNSHLLNSQPFQ